MGYMSAHAMAQQTDLDTALRWHLSSNHYPPVPGTMVAACKEAIEAYQDEDYHRLIDLPEPVTYQGRSQAPAWAIVEAHHLEAFL